MAKGPMRRSLYYKIVKTLLKTILTKLKQLTI